MAEFFSIEVPFKPVDPPKCTIFPLQVGFEASNFTQVPLQPSCADSSLKLHPLSNEFSIVTALGQWTPPQTKKRALLPEMEALHDWKTVS